MAGSIYDKSAALPNLSHFYSHPFKYDKCNILLEYLLKGKAHAGSDLDLLIVDDEKSSLSAEKLSAIKEAFSNSHLPILVDILN